MELHWLNQGSPSAGNEMTVGNAHINFNDGTQKIGLANFSKLIQIQRK